MINGKGLFIFVLGAVVGTVSTMYVLKKKYEAKIEEEVESLREVYKKNSLRRAGKELAVDEKSDVLLKLKNTLKDKYQEDDVNYFAESLDDTVPIYEGDKIVDSYKQEKINNLYKKPSLAELQYPMDSEEEGTVIVHQAPPYGRTEPYLIDDDQFMEDCEHHEKITLCYHSDGILAEENEEVIEDPIEDVGMDTLKQFDDPDTDVIYVRNCNTGIDYEIIRVVTSYAALQQGGGD